MYEFCYLFSFASLIKDHTCFKSVDNPSRVDLILTNMQKSFQNSMVIETGLSDFHKLTLTVLKTSFRKKPPTVIEYRNYKRFSHTKFRNELGYFLNRVNLGHAKLIFGLAGPARVTSSSPALTVFCFIFPRYLFLFCLHMHFSFPKLFLKYILQITRSVLCQ